MTRYLEFEYNKKTENPYQTIFSKDQQKIFIFKRKAILQLQIHNNYCLISFSSEKMTEGMYHYRMAYRKNSIACFLFQWCTYRHIRFRSSLLYKRILSVALESTDKFSATIKKSFKKIRRLLLHLTFFDFIFSKFMS